MTGGNLLLIPVFFAYFCFLSYRDMYEVDNTQW